MSDWLHNLPLVWMAIVVFACTFLVTAAIYWMVTLLAVGERARSFKAVSPGILPPLGIIFGLFVAFTAAQVWGDNQQAGSTVDREASALRAVVIFASRFPTDGETRLRTLIREHIGETTAQGLADDGGSYRQSTGDSSKARRGAPAHSHAGAEQ